MDRVSVEKRSANMRAVCGQNTKPELAVRRAAHAMGYRFRLHRRDLPGTPDLVFPIYKIALFVHGCFWHGHPGCRKATIPKSNAEFWRAKLARNIERDSKAKTALLSVGWQVEVIWECEITEAEDIRALLARILPPRIAARRGPQQPFPGCF